MSRLFSHPINLSAPTLSLQVSSSPVLSHPWQQQEPCYARLTRRPSDSWKHKNMRRASSTADSILLLRNRSRKERKWGTDAGFRVGGFGYPSSAQTSTWRADCAHRNFFSLFLLFTLSTTVENKQAHSKILNKWGFQDFRSLFQTLQWCERYSSKGLGRPKLELLLEYQQNPSLNPSPRQLVLLKMPCLDLKRETLFISKKNLIRSYYGKFAWNACYSWALYIKSYELLLDTFMGWCMNQVTFCWVLVIVTHEAWDE